MIARSLMIAVLGIVLYSLVLARLAPRGHYPPQSQWQDNIVKVENYILEPHAEPVVIVGSSLAGRLLPQELGPDVYNLAFAGGSPLTGLEILKRIGRTPQTVVIEIDLLARGEDKNILNEVFNPVLFHLRKYVPALREEYHPASFLCGYLFPDAILAGWRGIKSLRPRPIATAPSSLPGSGAHNPPVDPILFDKLFTKTAQQWNQGFDTKAAAPSLTILRSDIDYLEAKGVRCLFLDMPIDSRLVETPYLTGLRAALRARFPEMEANWIEFDRSTPYETIDGVHLHGQSQIDVSRRLGAMLKEPAFLPKTP